MQTLLPVFFALFIGIGHAFEPDHLLAVSQLAAKRDKLLLAMKDGLYWGLGHTTTLVVFGTILLLVKPTGLESGYFEAAVGVLLMGMGLSRLLRNPSSPSRQQERHPHRFAYAVGLLHGLAGSGALVLLVMTQLHSPGLVLSYMLVFGIGSVIGMFAAAGLMNIPFIPRLRLSPAFTSSIAVISSLLSIGYGGWMVFENTVL